jgi:hypothetical protein
MAFVPPQKCIAFPGDSSIKAYADPRDYRFWSNRQFAVASNTQWVRMWVDWRYLQPNPVANVTQSWDQLNTAQPVPDFIAQPPFYETVSYLRKLDRQIRAANDDGRVVILTILHPYPQWANGQATDQTFTPSSHPVKPASQRFPSFKADSPYAWFLSHLMTRYSMWSSPFNGKAPNPYGPHLQTYPGEVPQGYNPAHGNPSGAFITALEVCNEPNHLGWPQTEAPSRAADAMQTGYLYAQFYYDNSPADGKSLVSWPWILGPATLDRGGSSTTPADGTRYDDFTRDTLTELRARGFDAALPLAPYIGWSHHNYGDIAISNFSYSTSRAKTVKERLVAGTWKGGTDRNVWLTEGGYDMTGPGETWAGLTEPQRISRRSDQLSRVAHAINEMSRYNRATSSGEMPIFTQYQLHQVTSAASFETGMTEPFSMTAPTGPGAPRPIALRWPTLPDELS